MPGYTNLPKPTGASYNEANPRGKERFDDSSVLFDDPNTFFDGQGPTQYTNLGKPTGTPYTNVTKPI